MPLSRSIVALSSALIAMGRNPLRASLTALGIFVGVLAVTVVIALGDGADQTIFGQLQKLGENLVTIQPRDAAASGAGGEARLTLDDASALLHDVRGVLFVAPALDGQSRAVVGDRNTTTRIVGTTDAYFQARSYHTVDGSIWDPRLESMASRVVVIGPSLQHDLFPNRAAVGEWIRLGRQSFRVIGVLEEKGQTPFGMDQDAIAVMPIRTMRSKFSGGRAGDVGQILVRARPGADMDTLRRNIAALLRQRHGLAPDDPDDFTIRDSARIAEAQQGIVSVMRILLLSIAAVSLVIGGIGVMNIMLVSVRERTREIGTRLAVGARPGDILAQFLIEALVLTVAGGLLGALGSVALLPPLEAYFGWPLELSPKALLVALAVSSALGIGFGILPARRAAELDPVEALRRE
jgi:putative ABC transport system permease protein